MTEPLRVPYTVLKSRTGVSVARPLVALLLSRHDLEATAVGLVDSGADVNVLPYQVGISLGLEWDSLPGRVELSGNLANYPARGVVLDARAGEFDARRLAFAWTQSEHVPLILGQMNFFMAFEVCFFRGQNAFEIKPAEPR